MPGDLWRRYRDTADPGARRELMELYLGLVHHVAREMSRRTAAAELDDLMSAGTFGLIGALDSFDLTRGLAFSTYAVRRIRGAILDDLRNRDSAPRAVRVKARRLQVATTALERRLGRAPRPEEIAAQLDIDVSTYWRWSDDTATRTDAIARLTREERTVMALYYYEELNQRQITEVLHLTEARVSQIRTRALERLDEGAAARATTPRKQPPPDATVEE